MSSHPPVWFVTGCSSGFGQAIAREALARDHRVIATARRIAALQPLTAAGADALELDVTAPEAEVEAVVKKAFDIYGRLDHVVNAAGYVLEGAAEEISEREAFDQLNTNVLGTMKVCRAVLPHLRRQSTAAPSAPAAVIANFGSLASWLGGPGVGAYNASKWAVSGYTEALAAELAPLGFAVAVCVEPGMFRTSFLHADKRVGTARRLRGVYPGADAYRTTLDEASDRQLGDVDKGARVVVDVLTRTGRGKGEIPVRLPLGSDCVAVIRGKCEQTLKLLEEWEEVSISTDHDDGSGLGY